MQLFASRFCLRRLTSTWAHHEERLPPLHLGVCHPRWSRPLAGSRWVDSRISSSHLEPLNHVARHACGAIFTHSNSLRCLFSNNCSDASPKRRKRNENFYFSSRGMIRKKTYKILHKKPHKLAPLEPGLVEECSSSMLFRMKMNSAMWH